MHLYEFSTISPSTIKGLYTYYFVCALYEDECTCAASPAHNPDTKLFQVYFLKVVCIQYEHIYAVYAYNISNRKIIIIVLVVVTVLIVVVVIVVVVVVVLLAILAAAAVVVVVLQ